MPYEPPMDWDAWYGPTTEELMANREFKKRTEEEARKALSNFCKAVGTHGDKTVHIFSIPVDNDRDADVILSDVITERGLLDLQIRDLQEALIWMTGSDDFAPGGKARVGFEKLVLPLLNKISGVAQ